MYEVEHFVQTDSRLLHGYLAANPFAALVVATTDGLSADHLPMEFDPSFGSMGRLQGHVARANPLWRGSDSAASSALAIFSAHHGYISPAWYATKRDDPRVVPTWNYAAVHVTGRLSFFHDGQRISEMLARLTERFEAERAEPWRASDAPDEFIKKMIAGVVGFELVIEKMIGKWKLSQNRSAEDQKGVRGGLRREAGAGGAELADLMERAASTSS